MTVLSPEDLYEQYREARRLIDMTKSGLSDDPSVYLDAALALAQASVSAAEVADLLAYALQFHEWTPERFVQSIFRLNLPELPRAEELALPGSLIRQLDENRFWTGSDSPPLDEELRKSALWSLFRLNESLHERWGELYDRFKWSKWADRVPMELHPPEPPDLSAAFAVYFRLPPDSKPGRSFVFQLRAFARNLPNAEVPTKRLTELRAEIQAVKRELAIPSNGLVRVANEALPERADAPNVAAREADQLTANTTLADVPRRRTNMTVEEANRKAMELAKLLKQDFFSLSERKQAKRIGCSWGTWRKTTFYKQAKKKGRRSQRAKGERAAGSPSVSSLTGNLEAAIGEGHRDEVLNQLIVEQEADHEPSPLDNDPPDGRPQKVRHRKRL
jgi:hypothetical protein